MVTMDTKVREHASKTFNRKTKRSQAKIGDVIQIVLELLGMWVARDIQPIQEAFADELEELRKRQDLMMHDIAQLKGQTDGEEAAEAAK